MVWHIRKGYKLRRWLKDRGIDPGKGPSKYNTHTTIYKDHKYDSHKEVEYAMMLDARLKMGEIKAWEPHVKKEMFVNGYRVCSYKVDFMVTHGDGSIEYVEVKGKPTYDNYSFTLKRKLFEATVIHDEPDARYTIEL